MRVQNKYHIVNETTEDRFDMVDDLGEAIRIAQEVAKTTPLNESISIEFEGFVIRQFSRTKTGEIEEQLIERADIRIG